MLCEMSRLEVAYQSHSFSSLCVHQYVELVLIFILLIRHSSEHQFMLNMLSQCVHLCVQLGLITCTCADNASNVTAHTLNYLKYYLLYVGWRKETFLVQTGFGPQSFGIFLSNMSAYSLFLLCRNSMTNGNGRLLLLLELIFKMTNLKLNCYAT